MIYFIQNVVTKEIKIGYSKTPKKRFASLQAANPHELKLLGTIQGGLEHETGFHERFSQHRLQREWFSGAILGAVMAIIANDAANPQQPKTNVIVAGDSDLYFALSSDPGQMARKRKLEASMFRALGEIHAKTPIAWVIFAAGGRQLDCFAADWARKHSVQTYAYPLKFRRYRQGAASRANQQMLRSMFDPKILLVFCTDQPSTTTRRLIRGAEKAGIPVVYGSGQPQQVS